MTEITSDVESIIFKWNSGLPPCGEECPLWKWVEE
jgi:hypothetical protein